MSRLDEIRKKHIMNLRKDDAEGGWITINGAHIPLDKDGNLEGKVGDKISGNSEHKEKLTSILKDFDESVSKSAKSYEPNGKTGKLEKTRETRKNDKNSKALEQKFISTLKDLPKGTKITTNKGATYEKTSKDTFTKNGEYAKNQKLSSYSVAQQMLGFPDIIKDVE